MLTLSISNAKKDRTIYKKIQWIMSQKRDRKGEISRTKTEADGPQPLWSEGEMRFNSTLAARCCQGYKTDAKKPAR
jgi:hypothetical protein